MKHGIAAILSLGGMVWLQTAAAVSLSATGPAQPMPESPLPDDRGGIAAPPIETWSATGARAGSASLVPLMAADMQASQVASMDAPPDAAAGAVGKPIDDIAFVRQANESGRKELIAAREALPRLRSPDLKRVAQMLIDDHHDANARLSKIAATKGWPVPAPQAAAPPRSGGASADFDTRWTADMIAGHERSVALYRAQAQAGEDRELRQYAQDTLPTIEHHLEELRSLQK